MMEIIRDAIISAFAYIAKSIVRMFIHCSYSICLIACLLSLILYLAGMKKAKKYVPISFIVYFLCQAFKGAI